MSPEKSITKTQILRVLNRLVLLRIWGAEDPITWSLTSSSSRACRLLVRCFIWQPGWWTWWWWRSGRRLWWLDSKPTSSLLIWILVLESRWRTLPVKVAVWRRPRGLLIWTSVWEPRPWWTWRLAWRLRIKPPRRLLVWEPRPWWTWRLLWRLRIKPPTGLLVWSLVLEPRTFWSLRFNPFCISTSWEVIARFTFCIPVLYFNWFGCLLYNYSLIIISFWAVKLWWIVFYFCCSFYVHFLEFYRLSFLGRSKLGVSNYHNGVTFIRLWPELHKRVFDLYKPMI